MRTFLFAVAIFIGLLPNGALAAEPRPASSPAAVNTAAVADEVTSWEALHLEAHQALQQISREIFASRQRELAARALPGVSELPEAAFPRLIMVGFTGGLEKRDSPASGIVAMDGSIAEYLGDHPEVTRLTYNNFYWRRAASDVLSLAGSLRNGSGPKELQQPLIVVYGHSWGAGSISHFARELQKHGLEISLAIYIDAFTWRNPRVPANVRYAVNFYQRAGIFRGLPLRGKRKLIPLNQATTQLLGSYRIKPVAGKWGWSWNPLQPLFYRQHHLVGHDVRLQHYLVEIVNLKLELLGATEPLPAAPPQLFDRVVILGASVSADEKAPSPGRLLSLHMGTRKEHIYTLAKGGASSDQHVHQLDNIARLRPTLIVALDLFYHDFKISLSLSDAKQEYLRHYIRRLHDTGAVVVLGNIPSLVLFRHGHVNRFLDSLRAEFPNLVLLDTSALLEELDRHGINGEVNGMAVKLTREDLFADRVHLNLLGSKVMANVLGRELKMRFPERINGDLAQLPLGALDPQPQVGATP